ncbi:MAG: hypothetical protein HKN33_03760 [Pyrinomonadaceae bacterium]|nr:hypothetical protein [Pyrinomonadaceae bacterium]
MNLEQSMDLALAVFTQYESSTWDALEKAMYDSGISKLNAERILEFMPLAFGRVMMRDSGVKFHDTYQRKKPGSSRSKKFSFADNEVFAASLKYAERQANSRSGIERLTAVSARSPEMKTIQDLVNEGSDPKSIVLSSPVLGWTSKPENPGDKQWWQIW